MINKTAILLNLALLLAVVTPAQAETRMVPEQYTSIQEAIDAGNSGDVIVVSPGTYNETVDFNGKNIVVTSINPDDPNIVGTTIIDGNGQGSVVTFQNGESSEAMLTGFTITGGNGTTDDLLPEAGSVFWGAGILCNGSSPTITQNVITGNAGPLQTAENTTKMGYGGGICCLSSEAIIYRNIITNNAAFGGAGIMTYIDGSTICNNMIFNNSADIGGGVVLLGGSLINNTIVSNSASSSGIAGNVYAVLDEGFGQCRVLNNIICNAKSGYGVYFEGAGNEGLFAFNDVWGNQPGNYYDESYDGLNGNISADPLFTNGYHISETSPCFEAGDPDYVAYSWQRDIDGEYAIMGARADIGADEVTGSIRPVADAGPDQYFETIVEYITLNGTGSFDPDVGDVISYQWQQIGGPAVSLVNPDTAEPNFVPPVKAVYEFELVVSDSIGSSAPDSVMVVVGNRTPVANAGANQKCEPGQQVTLDGSESYDPDAADVLSYSWSQFSGPSVELSDPNAQSSSFTPSVEGRYIFKLIVSDGKDQSPPDVVIVNCCFGSIPDDYGYRWIDSDSPWGPKFYWIDITGMGTEIEGLKSGSDEGECVGPFSMGFDFDFYGNIYNYFYVQSNGLISFDNTPISYDNQPIPDSDGSENIIAWMWAYMYSASQSKVYYKQFGGYTVVQFNDYQIAWGGFVTAQVIIYESGKIVIQYKDFSDDAYMYQYTVGLEDVDGEIGTQVAYNDYNYLHDELSIEFSLGPPYEPVADAGPDQYIDTIELVTLDGSGSSDRDLNSVLEYEWAQIVGPAVEFSDLTAAQPTFMPESEGEYRFQLVVSDGVSMSKPDEVLVYVGNRQPVADAGPNRVVQVLDGRSSRVTFDGTGSYDLDLTDELIYTWTQLQGPEVTLSWATSLTPYFYCDEEGFYLFELIVNDGLVDSEPSLVEVTTVVVSLDQHDINAGYDGSGYIHYPDICGDYVVYSAGTGNDFSWDIKCKDMKSDEVISFSGGGIDTQPKMDCDTVVWFGGPISGQPWYSYEPLNTSVFAKNIATGVQKTLRVYSMSQSYSHPVVSGDKVVWLEHLNLDPNPPGSNEANNWWNTPYNVCGAVISDLENPVYFTIAENVGNRDPYPCDNYTSDFDDVIDISGNTVVYEADGDIYGADISNLEDIKVFTICSSPARQYDPAISGNLVVWTDQRNDGGDIYGADISDVNNIYEIQIIKTSSTQQQPAIDGCMITYVRGSSYRGSIGFCYLTKSYGVVEISLPSGYSYGCGPVIDGENIVWQTSSYGEAEGMSLEFGYSTVQGPVRNLTADTYHEFIQHAINCSLAGDVIVVDEGIYPENISFNGKNVTVLSIDPNDPNVVAATVIKGNGNNPVVTFDTGEDASCVLDGFTIEGGKSGVYCFSSSPTIKRSIITGSRGSGIKLWISSDLTLLNTIIAAHNGPGMEMWADKTGRFILHNYATITNCTIAGNSMHGIYGGIPTITSSIIYFNDVQVDSDLPVITYSDVQGGWTGETNISDDPLFADTVNGDFHLKSQFGRWSPAAQAWITDDVTSPCIDAGDPNSPIGDEPLPNGGRINMGSYGGTAEASKSVN